MPSDRPTRGVPAVRGSTGSRVDEAQDGGASRSRTEPVRAEELSSPPNDGSVADLVARAVREFPDRLAVEHDGETRTYAGLDRRVRAIATGLAARADPGDRVGLYLPNGVAFVEALLGCIHAGVVATPLNPQYRRREIAYQLDHSDAVAVVTDGPGEEHAVPVADDPDPGELREDVLSELAPYKHPRTVLVRPELPRTGSGKVRKGRLRELAGEERGE